MKFISSFSAIIAALLLNSNSMEAEAKDHLRNLRRNNKNRKLKPNKKGFNTGTSTNSSLIEAAPHKPQKIIGGDAVTAGSYRYPWFTRMMFYNSWGGCGGMLVAPEYVLTAAHCVGGFNGVQVGALCPEDPNNCGQVSGLYYFSSFNLYAMALFWLDVDCLPCPLF